jgi:hypothetical protein
MILNDLEHDHEEQEKLTLVRTKSETRIQRHVLPFRRMKKHFHHFVDFVQHEDGVLDADGLEALDEPSGHRADVGPPVTADVRLGSIR